VQLIMGVALLAGVLLCEAKTLPSSWDLPNDRASVEFADDRNGDVAMMWPPFQQQVKPAMSKGLHK